jgi:ATP-dependent RNA helicase DDX27
LATIPHRHIFSAGHFILQQEKVQQSFNARLFVVAFDTRQREIAMKRKQKEDDFVLTISDDEGNGVPDLDAEILAAGEDDPFEGSRLNNKSNKKRKRGADGNGAEESSSIRKKSKNNKTKGSSSKDDEDGEDDSLEEQAIWGAKDEDDGAMDSEFEFQLEAGEGADEAMGGFEGWGFESARRGLEGGGEKGVRGDKRLVDIDEIIRRRRAKTGGEPAGDVEEENGEGSEDGEADGGGEWEDEEDDAVLELVDDEQDEFMAEDGFGMGVGPEEEESGDEGVRDESDEDEGERIGEHGDASDDDSVATPVQHPDDLDDGASSAEDDKDDDPEEAARRKAFFAPEEEAPKSKKANGVITFQHMSLSRPIHRGLAAVGFSQPTPIQAKTIPVALLGKDVVGGAVTGSGKTAAFIVPILERLLYRPKKVPTSRVAILMPTRELAIQCHAVATKLASYTDIKFCLAVGGLSLKVQEAELRLRPDVIIATPGRFIDHMRNSASFTVDTLEILVLDEADRMLEDGFADELNEILTTIPKSRQTMLFSATMTSSVDRLIRVGLNRPVRLLVDAQKQTVGTLVQEFVRLRPGREGKRMGYLLYLCSKVYTDRVIVFFRQKKEAHRARVIFGLSGLKAAELHGSMSQEQVYGHKSILASRC